MQKYPKMLYRKSLEDWKIAQDEAGHSELTEQGYMTHAEYIESVNNPQANDDKEDKQAEMSKVSKNDIELMLNGLVVDFNSNKSKEVLYDLLMTQNARVTKDEA